MTSAEEILQMAEEAAKLAAQLRALAARVARQERALDEIVANAQSEAHLLTRARVYRHPTIKEISNNGSR